MARPKSSEERDLQIYLHVYFLRRTNRRANGKPMALSSCYEDARLQLEEQWESGTLRIIESNGVPRIERIGANLGAEGEYGAIRAACQRGRRIAIELAAKFGLPATLSDEERAEKVERCFVSMMPLNQVGAFLIMTLHPPSPSDTLFQVHIQRLLQEDLPQESEYFVG